MYAELKKNLNLYLLLTVESHPGFYSTCIYEFLKNWINYTLMDFNFFPLPQIFY